MIKLFSSLQNTLNQKLSNIKSANYASVEEQNDSLAKNEGGFTLIEIIIVVAIIAILATVFVPKVLDYPQKAKVSKAKQDIASFATALDLYKADNGAYPTSEQGLKALIKMPDSEPVPQNYNKGGYLRSDSGSLQDPWGHEYVYRSPGENDREFDIISLGADGKEGGSEFDADITSYDAAAKK